MNKTAAVITVSDKGFRGERADTSGPALRELLERDGWEVVYHTIVPDEPEAIREALLESADRRGAALVLTTGGTGFSPRDVTPEATRGVLERETPGIPEAMRGESMKITPHGCLSRGIAGIRGQALIVNLPGSEKAARENYEAVAQSLLHGCKMLQSAGSAECAGQPVKRKAPSADGWLREAKRSPEAPECGMYLIHNGVVRATARAQARDNTASPQVAGMEFSYDAATLEKAVEKARAMPGIHCVRVWLNQGVLSVGDDLMQVLVGGDTRPHVIGALESLVGEIKSTCVKEREIFAS